MLGYFPNKEVIAKLPKWVPGIENQHTKVQMDLTLTFKKSNAYGCLVEVMNCF